MTEPNKHILYVEDDPAHADITQRIFGRIGIGEIVRYLSDGLNAIQYLKNEGPYADVVRYPLPAVVLMDLRLPKLDGLEVLAKIRTSERIKHLPVVILSTSAARYDVDRSYAGGANGYLVKPMSYESYTNILKSFYDYWVNSNVA